MSKRFFFLLFFSGDFHKPVISPTQEEIREGIEFFFTCTVNHTCQKDKPNIIWNYQNMPASVETHRVSSHSWATVSTLKLKASRDDHEKTLTCTVQTTEGKTSDHVTLKVKSKIIYYIYYHISYLT